MRVRADWRERWERSQMSDVGHVQCYDRLYSHLTPPTSSEEPSDCECPRGERTKGRHESGCKKWTKRMREVRKSGIYQHVSMKRLEQWFNNYVAVDLRPPWHLTPYAGESGYLTYEPRGRGSLRRSKVRSRALSTVHDLVPVWLVLQGTWMRAQPQCDALDAERAQTLEDEIVALHAQGSSRHARLAHDVPRIRGESPPREDN